MKPVRRRFGFRDDAIAWIRDNGFYYEDHYGWRHAEGYVAIVEFNGPPAQPWALNVFKSAVPKKQENAS